MADCGCTDEAPCSCEGCKDKDATIRILYGKIACLEKTLR